MEKLIKIAFAIVAVFALFCGQIRAEGVHGFHKMMVENANIVAKVTISPVSQFKEETRVIGKLNLGEKIISSPAIGEGGVVYIGTMGGRFYAVGPDMKEKWSYATNGPIVSSATIGKDGTIYFGSTNFAEAGRKNFVYALYPDGKEKWKYEIKPGFFSSPASISKSPILYAGKIIMPTNNLDSLLFIDSQSGMPDVIPRIYQGGHSSSPNPYSINSGGEIYIAGSRFALNDQNYSSVMSLELFNGKKKWYFDLEKILYNNNLMDPVIFGTPAIDKEGNIYIGATDCRMYCFGKSGEVKWIKNLRKEGERGDYGIACSAAIDAEQVYFVTQTGRAIALKKADGSIAWDNNLGLYLISSPALTKSGEVCFGAQSGYFISLNKISGELKWTEKIGNGISSSPVVSFSGIAYVGSIDSCLYAFDLGGAKSGLDEEADWPMYGRNREHISQADPKILTVQRERVEAFELQNAFPNPFNSGVMINFILSRAQEARLSVYNSAGQLVATLVDARLEAGSHGFYWKTTLLSSGIYFYSLRAGESAITKKMIFLK